MAVNASADPNFTVVMRGYEREEVDAYLRDVLAEASRLDQRVTRLESDLAAARAKAESASSPATEFQQIGEETTRVLVAAETAAREMREKAERQADAVLADAERTATEHVEQASAHAERIVVQAEARQRQIEAEIRRLDTVRAEMVDRLRAAIGATQAAIGDAPTPDTATGPSPTATAAPDADTAAEQAPTVDEPVAEEPDGSDVAPEATEPAVAEEPPAPEPDADASGDDREGTAAPAAAATAAAATAAATAVAQAPDDRASPDAVVRDDRDGETAEQDDADAATVASGADRSAVEAALVEADAAAGRLTAAATATDADPTTVRERSLAGVRPGMLRRLRRSLQELQNGVLGSVRVRTGGTEVEDLLPTDAEAGALADVARVFLDAGYRAGRADAPVLVGDEPLQDPPTDTTLVADTADALARELLAELRTTLAPSLRAGIDATEPDASLSERVGEVFRDLKGPVVETVVDRHLTRTYGRATLDSWSDATHTRVVWVLGEETRCPAGVCRANEAEGAIELGSEFSSGHAVPPAHDGCTCALQPA